MNKIIEIIKKPSVYSILIPNLITIFFAVLQNWDAATIILIYWGQSIVIGLFFLIKIFTLRVENNGKSTDGIDRDKTSITITFKIFLIIFFIIPYGGFHYGYAEFILIPIDQTSLNYPSILISIFAYFIGHLYIFLYYKDFKSESNNDIDIKMGHLIDSMFSVYKRIIPIHLTIMSLIPIFIILSLFKDVELILNQIVLLIFLGMKTFIDVKSDLKQHYNK